MLTPEIRQQLIDKIRRLPAELEQTVANLNDGQLYTPYGPGKWTVRQVVHHLADAHCSAILRFKKTITEENPLVMAYPQDEFATLVDSKLPIQSSLDILRGIHHRWAVMLDAVNDDAWNRTA